MLAPFISYFGIPKQTKSLKSELENKKTKIQLTGLTGSSFSITASAITQTSKTPHLFIFRDKESASYFINDIESLLQNQLDLPNG